MSLTGLGVSLAGPVKTPIEFGTYAHDMETSPYGLETFPCKTGRLSGEPEMPPEKELIIEN
jgi:hypothetical protein